MSGGKSPAGMGLSGVVTEDDEVNSDRESVVEWDVDTRDRVRAQYDGIMLARLNRLAVDEAVAGPVEDVESDAGESSRSSEDEERKRRESERASAYGELAEVAARVGKISSMQMANAYRKGRAVRGGTRIGEEVEQRVFGLEGTEALIELESAGGLYDRLMAGHNVMVQYVARTGIGKTTRFASIIAKKCAMRVLLLQPDMRLVGAAVERQRDLTRVRDSWCRQRQEHLTVMTYPDFWGQFHVKNGRMMLEQFDVIIMDEAHIPTADVQCVKSILATFGTGSLSLLVLSATLEGEDTQAINAAPEPSKLRGRLVEAVEAGKLTQGARCRDRTMLILPTDEEVARCHSAIVAAGHTAYFLDSASRASECVAVRNALGKQSIVKRFLVATERYGAGYNFPLSAVYTDGSRQVFEMNEERTSLVARVEPVTVSEVKQHAGRVNRGMVSGGVSFVFTGVGESLPDVALLPSERLRAYLILRACGIKPLPSLQPPRGMFPFGVTPAVAMDILAINMPCELAVRFFNRDGRLAPNFARALSPFCQLQHYFVTSGLPSPIGHEKWVRVPLGGYYGSDLYKDVHVTVPFDVEESELRVKLHAVCAYAMGRITVPDWMPQLSDSEVSGDEENVVVVRSKGRMPRRIVDSERAPTPPPKGNPWTFDARVEGQMGYVGDRSGMLGGDTYTQATLQYLREASGERIQEVPDAALVETVDHRGVARVGILSERMSPSIEASPPVEVASPGGTVVVTLRKAVWLRLVEARAMTPDQAISLVHGIKDNISGFVRSTAFSNWSNAWLSVMRTCADRECLVSAQRRGVAHVLTALLHALYLRYSQGVSSVTDGSYVKSKFWKRVLNGRSVEEQLRRDRERGKTEVVQSERFFRRLAVIREATAEALVAMEQAGIFMPSTVTTVQHVLPITRTVGHGEFDVVSRSGGGQSLQAPRSRRTSAGSRSERSYASRSVF